MRVLMLAQFYPPLIGGEERFVRDFAAALAARGHEVAVATLWQDGMPDFEQDGAVRVYRIKSTMQRMSFLHSVPGRRHSPPFPDPEATLEIQRIIRRERPQIVHAHNWLIHSFLPIKAWSGAKLVMTLHDYSMSCVTKKLLYNGKLCSGPGLRKCLDCATQHYGAKVGVPTTLMNWSMNPFERSYVDYFIPESTAVATGNGLVGGKAPYEVIPVFVADDIGEPKGDNAAYIAQLPDEPYLMFAGAFGSYKGVDVLVRAYSRLKDAPPLVIIGYETAEHPVETKNFPPNVRVLKNWPHHAVMEAWRRSMIGLAPSVWAEPFGLVVVEAMACGKPVIASNIGGPADIVIDGETGILVPPSDDAALQQAIERLVDDPDLRERMGAAGRHRVAEFQAAAVVPRIERVYHMLLADQRKHSSSERPLSADNADVRG